MGNGSPQYRWRENSQSRSLYCTVPWPKPFSSSHAIIVDLASVTPMPSRNPELIAGPSPVNASPSKPSDGCTVRMTGRSYAVAKSQSRWSWPGTAMIAPVP